MGIWAKSNETRLSRHIQDILEVFEKISDRVSDKSVKLAVKLAILYHDLGKVLPKFQIETLGNKSYKPFDIVYDIPHSLFSIFWISRRKIQEKVGDQKIVEMIISAVAYHHWRESFDEFISGRKDLSRFLDWLMSKKEELKGNLESELKDLGEKFKNQLNDFISSIDVDQNMVEEIKNRCRLQNYAIPPYRFDYEPLRMKITENIEDTKKWILISGFLQRCDHFASWCEKEEKNGLDKVEIPSVGYDTVKDRIKQKIRIYDESKIWQISKVVALRGKDVVLIAPTGYGKTEFAFLWSADKKFIYTLPLRSAVNQIYERARSVFGDDKAGLLHSDADVYLLEKKEDVGDNIKLYELSKELSFPAMISTGDQFFPYALRPPGYEKIFSLFSYSNLVIDEVQAYDPKACAIVVEFIKWVKTMGGNFLLMTATMPEFVKNELENLGIKYDDDELNIYEEEKDKLGKIIKLNIYEKEKAKLEKIIKHNVKVELIQNSEGRFEIPDDILDSAVREAQNGKRVLFILNTVKQAQEVYKKLKEKFDENKVFLLHSRFTYEDRRKKELDIVEKQFKNPKPTDETEGKILVATQVVEASLDIDADVLFTEICPLDALVQRMGRVLRRISPVFEFENQNGGKRIYKNKHDENQRYEVDLSHPNVYVLVFENGLESGNGKVYSKELLKISLAWLWKSSKVRVSDIKFENDIDIIDKWISSISDVQFQISEYDKYKLVEYFYKSIPKDGKYLGEFYETLEILKAGYMSDRKEEAERIFREIYDINVIPENRLVEFTKCVESFIFSGGNEKNFTHFKRNVLYKYVVSIPYRRGEIDLSDWVYHKVLERVSLNGKWEKRLKGWLAGIYVADFNYDKELGVTFTHNERKSEAMIL